MIMCRLTQVNVLMLILDSKIAQMGYLILFRLFSGLCLSLLNHKVYLAKVLGKFLLHAEAQLSKSQFFGWMKGNGTLRCGFLFATKRMTNGAWASLFDAVGENRAHAHMITSNKRHFLACFQICGNRRSMTERCGGQRCLVCDLFFFGHCHDDFSALFWW